MKTILTGILLISIFFTSCSKPNNPLTTYWIWDDTTYNGYSTSYNSTDGNFSSYDVTKKHAISLYFTTPVSDTGNYSYAYSVTTYEVAQNNKCILTLSDSPSFSDSTIIASSTGELGDSVHITVINGTMTATFSNIKMASVDGKYTTGLVSGKLIEQK